MRSRFSTVFLVFFGFFFKRVSLTPLAERWRPGCVELVAQRELEKQGRLTRLGLLVILIFNLPPREQKGSHGTAAISKKKEEKERKKTASDKL